jgi:high-affinity iron transporter
MAASALLALREGLEAALVIGIVLGVLQKIDRPGLRRVFWLGVAAAVALSALVAVLLGIIGAELSGPPEMIFEGSAMALAAAILTWMIFWMRGQSKSLKSDIETRAGLALGKHNRTALFSLAFLSVFREGLELALFLLAAEASSSPVQTILGAVLGLGGAVLLGLALFHSTRKLSLQRFFKVTNFLLLLFAAGLVRSALGEFIEVGWIPPVIEHVWNLTPILSDSSSFGEVLKALFGYSSNPSLVEVVGYLAYFGALLATFAFGSLTKSTQTPSPSAT